ncbi:MAG TPA: hypothetical protein VG318_19140 [Actinomycetota bacterium]|nr:hypothetical protein [Actinomycetota bacterium]
MRPEQIEERVGHPGELWDQLKERVQAESVQKFSDVQADWLGIMWAFDAFRVSGQMPRNTEVYFGRTKPFKDLGGFYRTKGNLFAELTALLLQNQTAQEIGARTKVQGFSQEHQIDVAWPKRREDPLICAETKITGAPAYGSTPARGAFSDWSNRRKELKFAATDLKLFRRQQHTAIRHWGVWRRGAPPKTYFLWATRLSVGERSRDDSVDHMVTEARALVDTYLDGAGVFAWRTNAAATGYESVKVPVSAHVSDLDDVLYSIASEITTAVDESGGKTPEPELPRRAAVDIEQLTEDSE